MQSSEVIEEFVTAAVQYGEATLEGNSRVVNKQHEILRKLYQELREGYSSFESEIHQLLSHDNSYVRLHAACCLIPVSPTEAKEALVKLSSERGTLGFDAKMTLKEWEKGTLKII